MRTEQAAFAYVGAFVDELVRAGVRHLCLSPGSRSTPLALMFARHSGLKIWTHIDERSAGFFALGMARAAREPVALLCSSGTAAANYLPAVVEARYARVPLLVLTADRPHELRDCGAPQAIDQLRLYGSHVKWFVEMAVPEATPESLRYVRTVAGRATAVAVAEPAGPVHLNFPFREPLVPQPGELPADVRATAAGAWDGRPGGYPYVSVTHGLRAPHPARVQDLAVELRRARRGLIVCGPQDDPALGDAAGRLASALDYPVLADPLSQVRCGPHDRSLIVDAYDAFLRDPGIVAALAPDVVLRTGAMPTSKPLLLYLQRHPECRQIVVDGGGGWNEPTALASAVVHADARLLCQALVDALGRDGGAGRDGQGGPGAAAGASWSDAWRSADRAARAAIEKQVGEFGERFEGQVFAELARLLPDGSTLYAGNSMPVRDLDTFFPAVPASIRFLANRGANGIDGVVSSALGAAAADPSRPLVLVIGDLSFYHDLNGLLAARRHRLKATIVLVNNDGGGIFSFLPQADHPEHFEELFGTPTGLDFRPAVEMYGGTFSRVETWDAFRAAVRRGMDGDGLTVVEVRTDRAANVRLHRAVWAAVGNALAGGKHATARG